MVASSASGATPSAAYSVLAALLIGGTLSLVGGSDDEGL